MSLDAFKSLDPSIFEKMVDQAESEKVTRESTKGSGFADGIPEAFLPAGKHTLRIFADPNLQMYRMVRFFTVKDPYKRIMDPRFYKQTDGTYKCGETVIPQECIERLWELGSDLDYSHGSRTSAVFYGMVIDTDSPSEYWEKGKLYVIKGPGRFEDAWMAQMASMRSNPEVAPHIAKSLNPTVPGWGWSITVVKGAQGSVSMTPTFMKDYPAAEIEEGTYLPLKDLVVKDGFSMEDFGRLETCLLACRIEDGLDEEDASAVPAEGDSAAAAAAEGKEESKTEAKTDEVKVDAKVDDSSSRDALASALSGGKAEAVEDKKEEVKAAEAEDLCGLSPEQAVAAKAAGMSYEKFAEVIGLKKPEPEEDLCGLTKEQAVAAKAAGMSYEDFAKIVGAKK